MLDRKFAIGVKEMQETLPKISSDVLGPMDEFIRGLATAILPSMGGFDDVWTIANRVYDQYQVRRSPVAA